MSDPFCTCGHPAPDHGLRSCHAILRRGMHGAVTNRCTCERFAEATSIDVDNELHLRRLRDVLVTARDLQASSAIKGGIGGPLVAALRSTGFAISGDLDDLKLNARVTRVYNKATSDDANGKCEDVRTLVQELARLGSPIVFARHNA